MLRTPAVLVKPVDCVIVPKIVRHKIVVVTNIARNDLIAAEDGLG
jgi:mannose-6-phosphate isomerase-like protein (cupin superfamily)